MRRYSRQGEKPYGSTKTSMDLEMAGLQHQALVPATTSLSSTRSAQRMKIQTYRQATKTCSYKGRFIKWDRDGNEKPPPAVDVATGRNSARSMT